MLKKKLDKNINQISYNFLNLPNTFSINNQTSQQLFLYRADGVKLRKIYNTTNVNNGTFATITQYLDGFHYLQTQGTPFYDALNPMEFAYEQESFIREILQLKPMPTLQFFPTAEGFYDYENKEYIYQYKDHLGNVRVSYKKNGNTTEITDQNNYYPFGMNIPREEKSIVGTASLYNYKYQGQELQETGFYSFKWRNYMPDVGRFFNIDPLAEKYSYQSPYNFSENRVVNARELEGLEAWIVNGQEMTSAMPGWRTDARAAGFFITNPITAMQIGSVSSGSTNISSVTGRFARHFAEGTGTSKAEGSPSNAVRHGLWSAMIRNGFDSDTSQKATNAHEGVGVGESQYVDMSKSFNGKGKEGGDLADHIVDVLNNKIGMGIAEANPNASTKDLVSSVLGEFKNNGLWTFSTDKDGNVSITKSKLSQSQYNSAVKTVNSLNNNGFSQDEQKQQDDKAKENTQIMDRGPKW